MILYDLSAKNLLSALATAAGISALILAVATLLFDAEYFWYPIVTHVSYIFLIIVLLWLMATAKGERSFFSPKVRIVRDDGLIVADAAPWLGARVVCAIYIKRNEFEELTCAGQVENIQLNGLIQIRTTGSSPEYVQELKDHKDSVLIKPGLATYD